jgi:hypothetical protein
MQLVKNSFKQAKPDVIFITSGLAVYTTTNKFIASVQIS